MADSQTVLQPLDELISEKAHDLANIELHEADSHIRNLCFVWPDGRKAFFNYAYLIEVSFDPRNEKNQIRLNFSYTAITLEGYGLDDLFSALIDHQPRLIAKVDARYISNSKGGPEVLEIIIENKENTH